MTEPTIEGIFHGRWESSKHGPSHDEQAWGRLRTIFFASRTRLPIQEKLLDYARDLSKESELPKQLSDLGDRPLSDFRLVTCFFPMEKSELVADLQHRLWARHLITQRVIACANEELAHMVAERMPRRQYRVCSLKLIANTDRGFGFSTFISRTIDERRITILTRTSFARLASLLEQPFTWTSDLPPSASI
jgi:hypothetical protein